MRADNLIPATQRDTIVTALYEQADQAGWAALPAPDRSRMYAKWVTDPTIGGVLVKFMTTEAARLWIKDGPMKEYANANRGLGRFARYGRSGGTSAHHIARAALGVDAKIVEGSQGVKPPHCLATDSDDARVYLAWGAASNFRNLLWAALRASVEQDIHGHLVILEPPGHSTSTESSRAHKALTDRCGLQVTYLTESVGQRSENSA